MSKGLYLIMEHSIDGTLLRTFVTQELFVNSPDYDDLEWIADNYSMVNVLDKEGKQMYFSGTTPLNEMLKKVQEEGYEVIDEYEYWEE